MTYSRIALATSSPTVDAEYRAWVVSLDAAIRASGMMATNDSGQMDVTAPDYSMPTGGNSTSGYRVYRFADILQATSPIVMRVDFGVGSPSNVPQMTFTLGTGTNGAGTISQKATPPMPRRQYAYGGRSTTTVVPVEQVASGSMLEGPMGGRATFAFDLAASVDNNAHLLHIERLRDADGAPNNHGWWFFAMGANAAASAAMRYGVCQTAGVAMQSFEAVGSGTGSLPAVRSEGQGQGGVENADIPVGMIFPSSGRLWYSALLLLAPGRVSPLQTLPIDHLDASHTYMNLGNNYNGQSIGLTGSSAGVYLFDHLLVPWE